MLVVDNSRWKTSGRFASLMELYENNYLLIRLLVPELRHLRGGDYVSIVPGALDLQLSQIEHCRYTTTFNLTYRFENSPRRRFEPDLTIRLYHDARTAEVVTGLIHTQREDARQTRGLDNSWRLNRFLYKWIRYCLHQGHSFEGATVENLSSDHCPKSEPAAVYAEADTPTKS